MAEHSHLITEMVSQRALENQAWKALGNFLSLLFHSSPEPMAVMSGRCSASLPGAASPFPPSLSHQSEMPQCAL